MPTHPAGEALLKDARTLLPAADATRRRVRDVAAGQRTFTVGFMPGLIVTSAVRELSRRHPGLSVEVFRTDWTNQTGLLRDGPVDIGYLRLPADQYGLAIEPLFSETDQPDLPDRIDYEEDAQAYIPEAFAYVIGRAIEELMKAAQT